MQSTKISPRKIKCVTHKQSGRLIFGREVLVNIFLCLECPFHWMRFLEVVRCAPWMFIFVLRILQHPLKDLQLVSSEADVVFWNEEIDNVLAREAITFEWPGDATNKYYRLRYRRRISLTSENSSTSATICLLSPRPHSSNIWAI